MSKNEGFPGKHNAAKVQCLYLFARQHFVKKYKVRRAVEEDNDDIVPLIEMQTTCLKDMYGDYYIAEMISRHPQSGRQLIVAEHKEEAVAVMCVTEKINYDLINTHFELLPFHGLKKPSDYDHIPENYRASAYFSAYQSFDQVTPMSSRTSSFMGETIISEEDEVFFPVSSSVLKAEDDSELHVDDDRATIVNRILSRPLVHDDSDLIPITKPVFYDDLSTESLHSEPYELASISLLSWCNGAKFADEKDEDSVGEPACKHEYELDMNKDMIKLLQEVAIPNDLGRSLTKQFP